MTTASVLVIGAGGSTRERRRSLGAAARAASAARADELVAVVDVPALADVLPPEATVLLDEADPKSIAGALRVAIDWCQRGGHEAIVLGLVGTDGAVADPGAWQRVAARETAPIVLGERGGRFCGLARLDVMAWGLLPLDGDLETGMRAHRGLVESVDLDVTPVGFESVAAADRAAVERLLGRAPMGPFRVAVRNRRGEPVVIENAPFLDDGTPMPTTYWLVGRREQEAVGRLEAAGGVRRAEEAVPDEEIAAAHATYAAERDARIPADHTGPRPTGGVGGTRAGVKCLHAHLAWYLAGGPDPVGRFTARALGDELEGPVAAIDCGTNSTRLLILDREGTRLARETRITRLGAGVDETGALDRAAIARTLEVIAEYAAVIDRSGVVRVRCAATSAARDASNAGELLGPIEALLGTPAELLSGEEEGRLSYAGATSAFSADEGPFVVVDLGGGSTEFVTERAGEIALVSLALGCVRVRERFLEGDPPSEEELAGARAYARELAETARREHPEFGTATTMVGVAGTVSTLALVAAGEPVYTFGAAHLLPLRREQVHQLALELGALDVAARSKVPGIEPGRADVIAAGALVLDEVMGALGYEVLTCSESDILNGLAASLLYSGD